MVGLTDEQDIGGIRESRDKVYGLSKYIDGGTIY